MKRSKKYRAVEEKIDRNKVYSLEEAVKIVKENKIAKFDESIEIHIKTNVDTKKGDQQIRGTVELPHGTGKSKIIAVITSTHAKDAKEAGADIVEGEEFIEKIKSGKAFSGKDKFDILVATPEMMPKLAPVAKILGPKGLMPNPKTETVTTKIKETVLALKKGKAAFKNDDGGNIHQTVGKVSFEDAKLIENIKILISNIEKSKPATLKGKLISGITICSTMGVGLRISI
ncbi:MAG: 50S ribosomal protein L1 [Candidatus Moranbacteria bacterium RIFOXYA12_FULL_35_19]|nr:MAG: 50S ribosomal protein L1 [Candidatus Moranbacteria bacterium GW2011_GWF2_35_39]OGI35710.1 MAG: 50S ribosomal protein L1 [Candidatus Moranbacteria bacterium RIFOXYA12_FULL_35_19]